MFSRGRRGDDMKPEWLSESEGMFLIQTTVKMEAGCPSSNHYSIHLLSNMPTRHRPAAKQEEEGGSGMEELNNGGGGLGVLGVEERGCLCQSVRGWQLTPVPALATGNWPEPGQSCPAVCFVPVCEYQLFNPRHIHIYVSHLPSNSSHTLLAIFPACPWHLTSQSISFWELAWEHCIYPEHTLPVIVAEVFLFKLTFKPIHFSPSVAPQVCATT